MAVRDSNRKKSTPFARAVNGTADGLDNAAKAEQALRALSSDSTSLSAEDKAKHLRALGSKKTNSNNREEAGATELHRCIIERLTDTSDIVQTDSALEVLLKERDSPEDRRGFKLEYLLARDPKGRSLLNKLLDPELYSDYELDLTAIKPFLRFLLSVSPDLPSFHPACTYAPLHGAIISSLDSQIKSDIIRFLCCELGESPQCLATASERAIRSLTNSVSVPIENSEHDQEESDYMWEEATNDETGKRVRPLHEAIKLSVLIDIEVLRQLKRLKNHSGKASGLGQTKDIPLLYLRDENDWTCLHLALTAPFTSAKLDWARMLVQIAPELLEMTSKPSNSDPEQLPATPLQHFHRQRKQHFHACGPHTEASELTPEQLRRERSDSFHTTTVHRTLGSAVPLSEQSLDQLEEELKLKCLAIYAQYEDHVARSIIYPPDGMREISLGFDVNEIVSSKSLDTLSRHYKLDRILRLVEIPKISIDWDESSPLERTPDKWQCVGRTDLVMIFDWLKSTDEGGQNVKKLVEVIVEDFGDDEKKSHSDEVILYCLQDLDVEIWNWAKLDVSSNLIFEACGSHLREVHLYCSGQDAVLRSWADCHGLVQLKNLRKVHLQVHQGLGSIEYTASCVAWFITTLKRAFELCYDRDITVLFDGVIPAQKDVPEEGCEDVKDKEKGDDGYEEQEWIRCMDEFADIVCRMHDEAEEEGIPIKPVKVALLDDGVKTSYENLSSNVMAGRSFVRLSTSADYVDATTPVKRIWQPKSGRRQSSYTNSTMGHGTVMAYYIRRMCPLVKFYVAKLDPERNSQGRVTFTIESVVKAIDWAVEQRVDIISMSWAIDPILDDRRGLVQTALSKAANNILLFCANADKGPGQSNVTFLRSLETRIMCVGAATPEGLPWSKIASDDTTSDFYLPGVELGVPVDTSISAKSKPGQPPERWRKHHGSSLACAIGAGLAAMILHCTQLAGVRADGEDGKRLRTQPGMLNAMNNIPKSANSWLAVENFFRNENLKKTVGYKKAAAVLEKEIVEQLLVQMKK